MFDISKDELKKMKVIGTILAYELSQIKSKDGSNIINISIDYNADPIKYDVVEIGTLPNGSEFYITNQWNERFDEVQVIHSDMVKEYISHE